MDLNDKRNINNPFGIANISGTPKTQGLDNISLRLIFVHICDTKMRGAEKYAQFKLDAHFYGFGGQSAPHYRFKISTAAIISQLGKWERLVWW
jgi:hypothetical protein